VAWPTVSIVVVSWNRPDWLKRCLRAIGQLDYPRFEVVVVACSDGEQIAREMNVGRVLTADRANISVARNKGVDAAAGDIIAFIDDDAVPEPTWLWHLSSAFENLAVVQAGGTTLGRNGITVQHAAARVSAAGQTFPVGEADLKGAIIDPEGDRYPRLHGTNMAIRRDVIVSHGGFDERLTFYLDETDLTYRIAKSGGRTACVPKAIVHHASGPSRYRDEERTPRRVFEIAASAAIFHRKHCEIAHRGPARAMFLKERRRWIINHMVRGTLTPDRAYRLIQELTDGYEDGAGRSDVPEPTFSNRNSFAPRDTQSTNSDIYLISSRTERDRTLEKAKALVGQGHRVTVFDYRPTARYHRVAFTNDGYWRHTGGIFGRELRDEPLIRKSTLEQRVRKTLERLDGIRANEGSLIGH
jgi:GT2 family glycosyltransferase